MSRWFRGLFENGQPEVRYAEVSRCFGVFFGILFLSAPGVSAQPSTDELIYEITEVVLELPGNRRVAINPKELTGTAQPVQPDYETVESLLTAVAHRYLVSIAEYKLAASGDDETQLSLHVFCQPQGQGDMFLRSLSLFSLHPAEISPGLSRELLYAQQQDITLMFDWVTSPLQLVNGLEVYAGFSRIPHPALSDLPSDPRDRLSLGVSLGHQWFFSNDSSLRLAVTSGFDVDNYAPDPGGISLGGLVRFSSSRNLKDSRFIGANLTRFRPATGEVSGMLVLHGKPDSLLFSGDRLTLDGRFSYGTPVGESRDGIILAPRGELRDLELDLVFPGILLDLTRDFLLFPGSGTASRQAVVFSYQMLYQTPRVVQVLLFELRPFVEHDLILSGRGLEGLTIAGGISLGASMGDGLQLDILRAGVLLDLVPLTQGSEPEISFYVSL